MLSFVEDQYTKDIMEGGGRWVVKLNDGNLVYQDDNRPDAVPPSAWERLGIVCKANNLYIVDMYLQFRSNIVHLPSNADGYFFSKMAMGGFGSEKTWNFYIVGCLKNDILTVEHWKMPELLQYEVETRNVDECGINLIRRKK